MTDALEPYAAPRALAPDVHVVDGEWQGTTFRRRMTVLRLASGDLVLHSPIWLREADLAWLDSLGRVAFVVAPNRFHGSEAHRYAARYPDARVLVSPPAAAEVRRGGRVDGLLPDAWPAAARDEVDVLEFRGTRLLAEQVFFHRASRTLVLTDLVFNLQVEVRGLEGAFFRWNRIDRRFGPSKLFKWVFVNDTAAALASYRQLMAWDFDRVIMSHGDVLERGGKAAMQAGFEYVFGERAAQA